MERPVGADARQVRDSRPGPLDSLVPFIPPVLRVNRETRAKIHQKVSYLLSKEALENLALTVRPHWRSLIVYPLALVIWLMLLVYIFRNATEFAVSYVILSGFLLLGYHVLFGGDGRVGCMSAYSVFNPGTQRILGSLSAEQFENEIRHRHVGLDDAPRPGQSDLAAQGYGDDDKNLLATLKLSLQEKKREARRSKRATRNK